jgi:hypothetical protein
VFVGNAVFSVFQDHEQQVWGEHPIQFSKLNLSTILFKTNCNGHTCFCFLTLQLLDAWIWPLNCQCLSIPCKLTMMGPPGQNPQSLERHQDAWNRQSEWGGLAYPQTWSRMSKLSSLPSVNAIKPAQIIPHCKTLQEAWELDLEGFHYPPQYSKHVDMCKGSFPTKS